MQNKRSSTAESPSEFQGCWWMVTPRWQLCARHRDQSVQMGSTSEIQKQISEWKETWTFWEKIQTIGRNLSIEIGIRKWNHKQMKNNTVINSWENKEWFKKEQHHGDTRWFTREEHVHSHNKANPQYLYHKKDDINMLEDGRGMRCQSDFASLCCSNSSKLSGSQEQEFSLMEHCSAVVGQLWLYSMSPPS